jgi:hypothetical protein
LNGADLVVCFSTAFRATTRRGAKVVSAPFAQTHEAPPARAESRNSQDHPHDRGRAARRGRGAPGKAKPRRFPFHAIDQSAHGLLILIGLRNEETLP